MNDLDEFKKTAAFLEDLENEDNSDLKGDIYTEEKTRKKKTRSKDKLTQGQKFHFLDQTFLISSDKNIKYR